MSLMTGLTMTKICKVLPFLFLFFPSVAFAQDPTPVPVDVSTIGFVERYPNEIVGISYAVGLFFCLMLIANTKSRSTDIMAFIAIELFCFPIWFVNIAFWAASIAVWLMMYVLITRLQSVVKVQ